MISFKEEVQRIAPKGTERIVFFHKGLYLQWVNGVVFVGKELQKRRNNPLWYGGVEVTDVQLDAYLPMSLIGCKVEGITFIPDELKDMLWAGRIGETDPDEETILEYLLTVWPTSTPRGKPAGLKCKLTDKSLLYGMVGKYYNSKAGYYETLQKLTEYTVKNDVSIHILDDAYYYLTKGLAAAKVGRKLSYDGINFTSERGNI